jgi:hypothetical protein
MEFVLCPDNERDTVPPLFNQKRPSPNLEYREFWSFRDSDQRRQLARIS